MSTAGKSRSNASNNGAPSGESSNAAPINAALLNILRCPLTKSPLRLEGDVLVAERGGLRYPIRNGIPVLLAEEADLPDGVESLDALKKSLGL